MHDTFETPASDPRPVIAWALPQVPFVSSMVNALPAELFQVFPMAAQSPAVVHEIDATVELETVPRLGTPATGRALPHVPFVSSTTNALVATIEPGVAVS